MPPSTEHEGSFHGASAYAAIRFDLGQIAALFKGEPKFFERSSHMAQQKPLSGRSVDRQCGDAPAASARCPFGAAAGDVVRPRRRFLEAVNCGRRYRNDPAFVASGHKRTPALGDTTGSERRGLSRCFQPATRAHFRNLRFFQRLAAKPPSRVLRRSWSSRPLTSPAPQAALCGPFRLADLTPRRSLSPWSRCSRVLSNSEGSLTTIIRCLANIRRIRWATAIQKDGSIRDRMTA